MVGTRFLGQKSSNCCLQRRTKGDDRNRTGVNGFAGALRESPRSRRMRASVLDASQKEGSVGRLRKPEGDGCPLRGPLLEQRRSIYFAGRKRCSMVRSPPPLGLCADLRREGRCCLRALSFCDEGVAPVVRVSGTRGFFFQALEVSFLRLCAMRSEPLGFAAMGESRGVIPGFEESGRGSGAPKEEGPPRPDEPPTAPVVASVVRGRSTGRGQSSRCRSCASPFRRASSIGTSGRSPGAGGSPSCA